MLCCATVVSLQCYIFPQKQRNSACKIICCKTVKVNLWRCSKMEYCMQLKTNHKTSAVCCLLLKQYWGVRPITGEKIKHQRNQCWMDDKYANNEIKHSDTACSNIKLAHHQGAICKIIRELINISVILMTSKQATTLSSCFYNQNIPSSIFFSTGNN